MRARGSDDYFGAMGDAARCRAGTFGPGDDRRPGRNVVVISQALADRVASRTRTQSGGRDILTFNWEPSAPSPIEIIGVVGNVRHENLETAAHPMTVLALWAGLRTSS